MPRKATEEFNAADLLDSIPTEDASQVEQPKKRGRKPAEKPAELNSSDWAQLLVPIIHQAIIPTITELLQQFVAALTGQQLPEGIQLPQTQGSVDLSAIGDWASANFENLGKELAALKEQQVNEFARLAELERMFNELRTQLLTVAQTVEKTGAFNSSIAQRVELLEKHNAGVAHNAQQVQQPSNVAPQAGAIQAAIPTQPAQKQDAIAAAVRNVGGVSLQPGVPQTQPTQPVARQGVPGIVTQPAPSANPFGATAAPSPSPFGFKQQ